MRGFFSRENSSVSELTTGIVSFRLSVIPVTMVRQVTLYGEVNIAHNINPVRTTLLTMRLGVLHAKRIFGII